MSTDDQDATVYPFTPAPPPGASGRRNPRRSRLTKTAAGLALILGTGAGAAAVAVASTSGPTNLASNSSPAAATASTSTTTGPFSRPARGPRGFFGRALGGPNAPGFGAFGGVGMLGGNGIIHGTFTIKGPTGAYETIDTQFGTAKTVTSTSITVTSADNFSQTYDVAPSTIVDADSAGITSVNVGDEVSVQALVSGTTVTAERVTDLTQIQANRKSWAPGAPAPSSGSSTNGPDDGGPPVAPPPAAA